MRKEERINNGQFAFHTDVGRVRMSNEDQACALVNAYGTVLLIVCDGMGGQNKGDYASALAVSYIVDEFKKVNRFLTSLHVYYWLNQTCRNANSQIYSESIRNPIYQGMGTTLSIAIIHKKKLFTGQVGDSRIYSLKSKEMVQLTEDQTYVGYLYRTGQISKEEMATHPKRHMLMNALGVYPALNIDIKIKKYENESLLLCSDGLYNNANETTICSVLSNKDTPEEKVNELIAIANNNGGSDNIAVVIWESNYAD
ncbi:MAG: Stp1/IreP family PP2C-type Ser/Thr phosphatase [Erysipelotrichaceae bacterium]|nr:Stp1/IreP family PP2C-type Ser/Thr phosphatase [Erysipelotrichaceae bacterium]